jgi:hypothetical protein
MAKAEADLTSRVARLERRLRIAAVTAGASLILGALAFFGMAEGRATAAPAAGPSSRVMEALRVRELDIVDGNGVTRVKLAAPLPAPVIDGQQKKTRGGGPAGTMSGMLLFDAQGVERSGYATVDNGYSNVLLTLDDKRRQHAMFIAEPAGATTLRLFNGDTRDRIDVAIGRGGPSITMVQRGKEIYRQPAR